MPRTLALTAAAVALLAITACGSDTTTPTDQGAAVMCEEFVKERLKSPGSAEFAGVMETKITTLSDKKPWKYKVRGHVDSDNALGASIRNNYVCTITTEDADEWTLDDLQLTEH